jgi:hypothetical protein
MVGCGHYDDIAKHLIADTTVRSHNDPATASTFMSPELAKLFLAVVCWVGRLGEGGLRSTRRL